MKNQEVQKPKATAAVANEWLTIRKRIKALETKGHTDWSEEDDTKQDELYQQLAKLEDSHDFRDSTFVEDSRYGVKNVLGEVIVPPIFEEIPYLYTFKEPENRRPYPVKHRGHYGLVAPDGEGNLIVNCQFDDIEPCIYNDEFYIKIGDKFGLIDKNGKMLVPPIMDSFTDSLTNVRYFEANGKKGFLYGPNDYYPPLFDEIEMDIDTAFKVRIGDQWGWLDERGEFTLDEDQAALGEWM